MSQGVDTRLCLPKTAWPPTCWNPGIGNNPDSNGNGGIKFPNDSNPNTTPCGAGTLGNGNDKGNGVFESDEELDEFLAEVYAARRADV